MKKRNPQQPVMTSVMAGMDDGNADICSKHR